MAEQPQHRLTPEEYLELDRASEFRHEYYDGFMYAMSGGTHPHAILAMNLGRRLANALEGRDCIVTVNDLRVRISPHGLYTYPDVVVVCGKPQYADGRIDTLLNPVLLIEVLSPSTESRDRGFKSAEYRTLASLQEYAIVSQTEARLEVFRRLPSGGWLLTESVGLDAACTFDSVGATIPLREIYDKVTFPEATPPEPV